MSKDRHLKTFEITLSAMSTALAVIFLYVGTLNTFVLVSCFIFAEVSLMLPLSKGYVRGNLLAYAATCILTLILGAVGRVWLLVPFIMFLGLHPVVNYLQVKHKINKWLAYIVKAIWFDAMLYVGYKIILGGVIGTEDSPLYELLNKYAIVLIIVGGAIFFAVYDYFMFRIQVMVNRLIRKIKK